MSGLVLTAVAEAQTCGNPNVPLCYQPTPPIAVNPPTPTLTVQADMACTVRMLTGPPPAVPVNVGSTVPDGAYFVSTPGVPLRVDVAASTTGGCQFWSWGQYYWTNPILLNWVHWYENIPDTQTLPNFAPSWGTQVMDTTQAQPAYGSGPQSFFPALLGNTVLAFFTEALSTSCNTPTVSSVVTRNFNVVACEPKWSLTGNPLVQEHLQATTITLYIPPGPLYDTLVGPNANLAAASAVAAWNQALAGTGVTLQISDQDCGSGPACIPVSSTTSDLGGCAQYSGLPDVTTGEIRSSTLQLQAAYWPNASQARLTRTIAHELAHALGLDHNKCALTNSLMSVPNVPLDFPSVYAACTDATGMTTVPNLTDILPLVQSTYGNHNRTVCGYGS
jgi:hypothetical protein